MTTGSSNDINNDNSRQPLTEQDPLLGFWNTESATSSDSNNNNNNGTTADTTSSSSSSPRPPTRHHRRRTTGVEHVLEVIQEGAVAVVETAEAVVETVADVATHVAENVVEEAHHIADDLVEEMNELDQGESYFLDMSLARSLSIIPNDVVATAAAAAAAAAEAPESVVDEAGVAILPAPPPPHEVEEEFLVAKTPISAYFLLASAVVALSSIGPLLDLQQNVTPTMKIYWRMSATAMLLFPLAVVSIRTEGLSALREFTTAQWTTFVLTAASYATMCIGFVQALEYTAVGNAVILSNSQAILLLVAKFVVGEAVQVWEGLGALTAFSGAILCSKDSVDSKPIDNSTTSPSITDTVSSNNDDSSMVGKLTLLGDLFALISGLGGKHSTCILGTWLLDRTFSPVVATALFY